MTGDGSRISNFKDQRLEVGRRRLRESVSPADTLEAIRDIVTNLLGCEEMGLFTVEQGSSRLWWSSGIDPQRHVSLDIFEESILQRVLQGEFHVSQVKFKEHPNHANPALRVFVPIRLDGRTVAVLVMLKLLPQKLGFDEADIELVNLLSSETGRTLFGASASANA